MSYSHKTHKIQFDPTRLKEIIERSGLSRKQVGEVTDIPVSTMNFICAGRVVPNISAILTLADFFGVTVEELCGLDPVPQSFEGDFGLCRRADYEVAMRHGKPIRTKSKFGEAPYPYNLLDTIVGGSGWDSVKSDGDYWGSVITPDQEAGLEYAVSTLKQSYQDILRMYFQEDKTLAEIGEALGRSRQYIQQVIARAARLLRHPSKFNFIQYGYEGYGTVVRARTNLDKELTDLEDLRREVARSALQMEHALQSLSGAHTITKDEGIYAISIEEMDLSVRAFNCLCRADIRTVGDLVRKLEGGYRDFLYIRNMGQKTASEIISKLQVISGVDYLNDALQADEEKKKKRKGA